MHGIGKRQDRPCTYNATCNAEARSYNNCCSEKAISITHPQCVFKDLSIQQTMRMRHTVICGPPGSTIFSILSHKRHGFREKKKL